MVYDGTFDHLAQIEITFVEARHWRLLFHGLRISVEIFSDNGHNL